ncbi:MAG: dTDP-glucose 4,6-dehydratase [Verrucomicrobiota bacterium]
MRLLLTGGAGFIGSNLARHLLSQDGYEILVVDKLTYAGQSTTLRTLEGRPGYQFLQADIADAPAMAAALARFQPDAVLNLAAESHVDRSITGPAPFIHSNLVGTYTLLDASLHYYRALNPTRQRAFRFLQVSTDEVYGDLAPGDDAFRESDPYRPSSPYSASKAGADHLVRAWHRTFGLPVLIAMGSNNYGPYQHPEKLIPTVILRAWRQEAIPIYGDGSQQRDWLYVDDHVTALERILADGHPGESYHVGGHCERANLDLARHLCRLMDEFKPRPGGHPYAELIEHVTDRPGHDRRYAMDFSRLRREFGWEPQHAMEQALRHTVQWYLENESWWASMLDPKAE